MDFCHSDDGSALVEFAVCVTVLVLLLVGIADYALLIQQAMQVSEAAAAGASYGAIPGNSKDTAGMQTAAQNAASGLSGFAATAADIFTCSPGGTAVTSSTICTGYGTPIEYVQVKTSATVYPLLKYTGISSSSIPLKATATYRVQWVP
jgi:Flp pilus assembly protein TadG